MHRRRVGMDRAATTTTTTTTTTVVVLELLFVVWMAHQIPLLGAAATTTITRRASWIPVMGVRRPLGGVVPPPMAFDPSLPPSPPPHTAAPEGNPLVVRPTGCQRRATTRTSIALYTTNQDKDEPSLHHDDDDDESLDSVAPTTVVTSRRTKRTIGENDNDDNNNNNNNDPDVLPRVKHNNNNNNNNNKHHDNSTYNFWDKDLTLTDFYMDLQNMAYGPNPHMALDALEIMVDLHSQGKPSTVRPDGRCYNTVLEGLIQAGYLEDADDLLLQMEQPNALLQSSITITNDTSVSSSPSPTNPNPVLATEYSYMLLAQGWADYQVAYDVSGQGAQKAEDILRRMQTRGGFVPSVKVWSIVVEAWCKRTKIAPRSALQRAQDLLTEMEEQHPAAQDETTASSNSSSSSSSLSCRTNTSTIPTAPPPNLVTYTSYIGGLARSHDWSLARKADATLARMERFGIAPDVVAYTSVLNCWAKTWSRREREMAAPRALRIVQEMEYSYHVRGNAQAKPTLISYATAIRAIGNHWDGQVAATQAQALLKRLYQLYDTNAGGVSSNQASTTTTTSGGGGRVRKYHPLKPTTTIYNAVLNALSRAATASPKNRLRYVRRAEQYLAEMHQRTTVQGERDVQPNVRTYAAVLRCWAMSGVPDAAENAQRVLDEMVRLHQQGKTHVRPNYVCYTTVMGAWRDSRKPQALTKMESLLQYMEDEYTKTQQADIRPNTISYVVAIDGIVKRKDSKSAQRAQSIVDRMMTLYEQGLGHVRPTRLVFNALLHAWSKSPQPTAAERAEEIFQWMEEQHRAGDVLLGPDEVSLGCVLNAWANQAATNVAAPQRAQQIFDHMQSLTLEQRGFHISIMTPNIVIKAIARSKHVRSVEMAEQILLQLEQEYQSGQSLLRPDVTTYSSVINCCAYYKHAQGKTNALQVALRTFGKLCQLESSSSSSGDGPNNISYGTLFKAIGQLMPLGTERTEMVQSLFDKCCEQGFVDAFVLSVRVYMEIVVHGTLDAEPCVV